MFHVSPGLCVKTKKKKKNARGCPHTLSFNLICAMKICKRSLTTTNLRNEMFSNPAAQFSLVCSKFETKALKLHPNAN
jgi:hypothetical protein